MSRDKITKAAKDKFKKLKDNIGSLKKTIQLKRMEPYADIIAHEFGKYNTDDSERTMMIKLMRNPVEGTTTRRKHTENVAEIAGEIADHFDWLNSDLTRIMARNHDTGHTWLGHSGEWWLSGIKSDYGTGYYVHNALGPKKLIYRNDIFSDIEKAIREQHPDISEKKLKKIKRDLWLLIDGINCHNGERSEAVYYPDFSKTKKRFYEELMGCFIKKGYDKNLVPATAEGSLMRLCDKISYIPFDLVDTFRNGCNIEKLTIDGVEHNFYEQYRMKFKELGMADDSLERLLSCKTEEEYDAFAREMQEIFIKDVKTNTRRHKIQMSPEMSKTMHSIRDINNMMMVNYVVMKEDHEVYPVAAKELIERYRSFVIENNLINPTNIEESNIINLKNKTKLNETLRAKYSNQPDIIRFIDYIEKMPEREFKFTVDMLTAAYEQSIDTDLEEAKKIALLDSGNVNIEIKGDFRRERIEKYISMFRDRLAIGYDEELFNNSTGEIDTFKKEVWLQKAKVKAKSDILMAEEGDPILEGTLPFDERLALEFGSQFIASLNDREWRQLLLDSKLVDENKMASLTRKYSDFDFRGEHKKHEDWSKISSDQAIGTNTPMEIKPVKQGFISRAKRFLGIERER